MNKYKRIKLKNGKTRDEHRIVMENFIGRQLCSNELVHHKNENRSDNRIENLEITTRSEHARLHNKGKKLSAKTKHKLSILGKKPNLACRKLTEKQVKEIRESKLNRETLTKVYNVSKTAICDIINHKSYRNYSNNKERNETKNI